MENIKINEKSNEMKKAMSIINKRYYRLIKQLIMKNFTINILLFLVVMEFIMILFLTIP